MSATREGIVEQLTVSVMNLDACCQAVKHLDPDVEATVSQASGAHGEGLITVVWELSGGITGVAIREGRIVSDDVARSEGPKPQDDSLRGPNEIGVRFAVTVDELRDADNMDRALRALRDLWECVEDLAMLREAISDAGADWLWDALLVNQIKGGDA